jgi:hypothetical protein
MSGRSRMRGALLTYIRVDKHFQPPAAACALLDLDPERPHQASRPARPHRLTFCSGRLSWRGTSPSRRDRRAQRRVRREHSMKPSQVCPRRRQERDEARDAAHGLQHDVRRPIPACSENPRTVRLSAKPKRWISVTAPVAPLARCQSRFLQNVLRHRSMERAHRSLAIASRPREEWRIRRYDMVGCHEQRNSCERVPIPGRLPHATWEAGEHAAARAPLTRLAVRRRCS